MTARSDRPQARWPLVVALAVGVIGVGELGMSLVFARRTPRLEAFVEAAAGVDAVRPVGAPIVVAPEWLSPVARQGLGEGRMPIVDIAWADATGARQVVELSANGARRGELAGWREVTRARVGGGMEARVLANPRPVRVVRDFVSEVGAGEATVVWQEGERATECPWRESETIVAQGLFGPPALPARRFVCGGAPWQSVAVTVHEDEGYRPRRCVWSHPPPGGGAVEIRFRAATLGQRLRGHGSLHWTLERERRGSPVMLDVLVDGESVGGVRHEDGQGWAAFELPLGKHAGTSASVSVRVHSDDAAERHFCWQLDSRSDD